MRANTVREMTNKANEARRLKRIEKHRKYVNKIIKSKIYKQALSGNSIADFTIRKGYSPSLISEEFSKRGFSVATDKLKNGKTLLVAKW